MVKMGSIPACAGEPVPRPGALFPTAVYPRVCGGTRLADFRHPLSGVYPRVCGGTQSRLRWGMMFEGLSPRVRGNRFISAFNFGGDGSIPACAGEPPRRRPMENRPGVYPRVCGGTAAEATAAAQARGLSPRVRGNHLRKGFRQVGLGSIPACAGEPRLILC